MNSFSAFNELELGPVVIKMQIAAHLLRHSLSDKKVAVHFVVKTPDSNPVCNLVGII